MSGFKQRESKKKGICNSGDHNSLAETETQYGITTPDYAVIVKMNWGWQRFFESLAVQILSVESSLVSKVQQTTRNEEMLNEAYRTSRSAQALFSLSYGSYFRRA